jgi:hypothetical protein
MRSRTSRRGTCSPRRSADDRVWRAAALTTPPILDASGLLGLGRPPACTRVRFGVVVPLCGRPKLPRSREVCGSGYGRRVHDYASGRSRPNQLQCVAASVVIVLTLAALSWSGSSPAAARTAAAATRKTTASVAGSWRLLPNAPIAPGEGVSSVWTGTKMLVFGRVTTRAKDGAVLARVGVAAAYDPAANSWRRLPSPGPTSGFMGTSAVWTGKELVIWGQGTREAFNPLTNRWRRLPNSRYLAIHDGFGLVVWTGREMIGWGGGCCGDAFDDGVAYNPATNSWRNLAHSPLAGSQHPIGAWTGRELIVVVGGLDPDGKPWPARLARVAAYNPVTNTWRRLAPLPESRNGANAVWDGRELLVVGGAGSAPAGKPAPLARVGFAYNPATNGWRPLPPMEAGRAGAADVWTGTRLLVWGGRANPLGDAKPLIPPHGLAYDPRSNSWSPLPQAPLLGRIDPTAVWTRQALIVWGGETSVCRSGARQCTTKLFRNGASFTPSTR